MILARYTASIHHEEQILVTKTSNDLQPLISWLMVKLEDDFRSAKGAIIDNYTRRIIHQAKRVEIG